MLEVPGQQPEHQPPAHEQLQLDHWKAVYEAARRAWDTRVQEVQNQQQRIASVLTANGLLLGFLGAAVPVFAQGVHATVPIALFLGALCALALGLGAGALALWPTIVPKGGEDHMRAEPADARLFLEASQISRAGKEDAERVPWGTQHLYERLVDSIVVDATAGRHVAVIKTRKRYIRAQLLCLFAGAVLLLISLFARLVAS